MSMGGVNGVRAGAVALVVALLVFVWFLLRALTPQAVTAQSEAPGKATGGKEVARSSASSRACVRVATSSGEGLSGVQLKSDQDDVEHVTDSDGVVCLFTSALPAQFAVVDWPAIPTSLLLSPGDTLKTFIVADRCALALDVEREAGVPPDRPQTVRLTRPEWEATVPVVGTHTVPCGKIDVWLPDDSDLTIFPLSVMAPSARLHIGIRPTIHVRVFNERRQPIEGASVDGTHTDSSGYAVTQLWAPLCVEIAARGYVGTGICPGDHGWPTGEQEVVLAPARRVQVLCGAEDGPPEPCALPRTAICVGGEVESPCSREDPFVCECPKDSGATVVGGERLLGWTGPVEGDTAILRPGNSAIYLVGDAVESFGDEACGSLVHFILDGVGARGSRLLPRKAACVGGRVGWSGLAAGRWRVLASEGPIAAYGPFLLAADEDREIRLESMSEPRRRIAVNVREASGAPASNVMVRVRYSRYVEEGDTSNRHGEALVDLGASALEILGLGDGRACREPVPLGDSVTCVLEWDTIIPEFGI